jgi:hypothetical protein
LRGWQLWQREWAEHHKKSFPRDSCRKKKSVLTREKRMRMKRTAQKHYKLVRRVRFEDDLTGVKVIWLLARDLKEENMLRGKEKTGVSTAGNTHKVVRWVRFENEPTSITVMWLLARVAEGKSPRMRRLCHSHTHSVLRLVWLEEIPLTIIVTRLPSSPVGMIIRQRLMPNGLGGHSNTHKVCRLVSLEKEPLGIDVSKLLMRFLGRGMREK